jgi:hypothetical protein
MATYKDEIFNPSRLLPQTLHLSGAIRSGAAPGGGSVRGDASAGVATARFTLQLTFRLMPELRLMALKPPVLLPKLEGALSYPVLYLVGMLFHINALPAFSIQKNTLRIMAY